ncbi:hypothetical protein COY17_00305 [Candidatus Saccharibacteria bacterium CG_4_10_14_0_2_um_filter_52_9]|nr:MAG: hypothetical protein COY17_00305 [Candidatus Saccharibacteria bacterium CG_4_10_14_0_2_um_filter_52_9]
MVVQTVEIGAMKVALPHPKGLTPEQQLMKADRLLGDIGTMAILEGSKGASDLVRALGRESEVHETYPEVLRASLDSGKASVLMLRGADGLPVTHEILPAKSEVEDPVEISNLQVAIRPNRALSVRVDYPEDDGIVSFAILSAIERRF